MGLAAFTALGLTGWGVFLSYAANQERVSSSVVRQILLNLRHSDLAREALGESIRPEPTWYLNGDPWVSGSVCRLISLHTIDLLNFFQISMLQGSVDISMRVKGSKGTGTLYFTSIRKEKGQPFTICVFCSLPVLCL